MEGDSTDELLLAEEQAVINRGVGIVEELEAAFDTGKETEGTLVLTNRRLIYAQGTAEENLPVGETMPFIETKKRLVYSDVKNLDSIPAGPPNFSIRLDSIASVVGHHKAAMAPKLEVRWNDGGREKVTEFVQQITGGSRRRNLNDWASVIQRLKDGKQKITGLPPPPDRNSLEGKVFLVLGDMQEKGLFTIEAEVEEQFSLNLDPDDLEKACDRLVSQGLVKRSGQPGEDPFYQKISPLGDDDLNL